MPIVETNISIEDVSLDKVWEVMCDFESYPSMMDDVVSVRYLKRDSERAVSEWKVLLNGSELNWVEEDDFTPLQKIRFKQIEGDLEVFEGVWELKENARDVNVSLKIEFDLGIPSLAEILNPIGISAIKANSRQMLESIKACT